MINKLKNISRNYLLAALALSLLLPSIAAADTLSGTMSVSTLDFTDGSHQKLYMLTLDNGDYVYLDFSDLDSVSTHVQQSGAQVLVEGSYNSQREALADYKAYYQVHTKICSKFRDS